MSIQWPHQWKDELEQALSQSLNKKIRDHEWPIPEKLVEAMRYALLGGGKRLRPLLVLQSAQLCSKGDIDLQQVLPAAMAVEYVHAYSLVHDDLPSLDNDDFRRGKPTVHKKFGEATAILCGDALLSDAFGLFDEKNGALCVELARAAGSVGMVGGQMQDMLSEGPQDAQKNNASKESQAALLYSIHARKTARLISCACTLGALSVKGTNAQSSALATFGRELGIAFQIADDILDVAGEFEKRGKVTGADASNDKLTFVSLYGLEGARQRAREKIDLALLAIENLGDTEPLSAIARYAIERDR